MILETDRLYLRKLNQNDAWRMSEYRNKEEVAKYQSWEHYSYNEAKNRIMECERMTVYNCPKTDYHLGITLKNNFLIGDLFIEIVNKSVFVLGYTLDSFYWNHGYAYEMIHAFLAYMKETYHMKKVICYVYQDNVRSIRLLKKLGFYQFDKSYFYDDVGYLKKL